MIENEMTQTNIFFVDDNVFFKRSIFFNIMIKVETTKTNIFFVDDIIFFNREKNETIKFFIDRIEFYNQRKNEIQRVKLLRNRSIFENYRERDVCIDNSTTLLYNYKSQIFEHMNTSINHSKFDIYITIEIFHQFVVAIFSQITQKSRKRKIDQSNKNTQKRKSKTFIIKEIFDFFDTKEYEN